MRKFQQCSCLSLWERWHGVSRDGEGARRRPPVSYTHLASDKTAYAKACRIQMDNQDVVSGQIIVQKQSEKYLVQNIPAKPVSYTHL